MAKPFTPKVVTANALIEGDVVYLAADDSWSRELSQAELLEDEAKLRALFEQTVANARTLKAKPTKRAPRKGAS